MKFQSFSSNPGTTGQRYYSYFFKKYGLDYSYTPLAVTDLEQAVLQAQQSINGFSVSMPFKQQIIHYLDSTDDLVDRYQSCNTVLIKDSKLLGYNADYYGALAIIKLFDLNSDVSILGNGSMGSMFGNMLPRAKSISRSLSNWQERHLPADVFINCTALGTINSKSPFEELPNCQIVVDLALRENHLKLQCLEKKIKYVSGIQFYKYNFLKQFEIYTGIQLHEDEFEEV